MFLEHPFFVEIGNNKLNFKEINNKSIKLDKNVDIISAKTEIIAQISKSRIFRLLALLKIIQAEKNSLLAEDNDMSNKGRFMHYSSKKYKIKNKRIYLSSVRILDTYVSYSYDLNF